MEILARLATVILTLTTFFIPSKAIPVEPELSKHETTAADEYMSAGLACRRA
ncbi:unnamed protein product [Periconia digitata]|uniref:Uncharacterized protein n=1 Tax=Periconia digitata TaxID=1303443 RepID=A0A9W4UTC9_9PLEO|nr:unnamed protein product [Periconia digitata]